MGRRWSLLIVELGWTRSLGRWPGCHLLPAWWSLLVGGGDRCRRCCFAPLHFLAVQLVHRWRLTGCALGVGQEAPQ